MMQQVPSEQRKYTGGDILVVCWTPVTGGVSASRALTRGRSFREVARKSVSQRKNNGKNHARRYLRRIVHVSALHTATSSLARCTRVVLPSHSSQQLLCVLLQEGQRCANLLPPRLHTLLHHRNLLLVQHTGLDVCDVHGGLRLVDLAFE